MAPGAVSPRDRWFDTFQRGVKERFPHYFGDVNWNYRIDRSRLGLTVGDRAGAPNVTTHLPLTYLGRDPWLVAAILLGRLRGMAEDNGLLKPRP